MAKVGRPLAFESVEELDQKIDEYFKSRDAQIVKVLRKITKADGSWYWGEDEEMLPARPKTMAGLARFLNVRRETLVSYKDKPEFSNSISRALAECEEYAEEQLFVPGLANGAKFALTNNYGWEDKKVVDNTNREVATDLDKLEREKEDMAESAKAELDDSTRSETE